MAVKVDILKEGYSIVESDSIMWANGSCSLIRDGAFIVLVDTLTAWDRQFLIDELQRRGLACEDITHVVCTHGHSDHIGNLNLFTSALHIVGQCVSHKDKYETNHFEEDTPYRISDDISVLPTPGHTLTDVSVVVKNTSFGTVVATGDLFEREEDIANPDLWRVDAGSENAELQYEHRKYILSFANYIIPGHGPMFRVTEDMINLHNEQLDL